MPTPWRQRQWLLLQASPPSKPVGAERARTGGANKRDLPAEQVPIRLPRITVELHQQGVWASRSRVANDAEHHIQSVVRKKHRIQITDSGHA